VGSRSDLFQTDLESDQGLGVFEVVLILVKDSQGGEFAALQGLPVLLFQLIGDRGGYHRRLRFVPGWTEAPASLIKQNL